VRACVRACVRRDRRKGEYGLLGGIRGEKGGAGAHWNEVFTLDCVRRGIFGNIDCYQSYLPRW